jgi:hypothetical protein
MTETTLSLATSKSESLRTTVPSWVVSHFKLKEGDILDWEMKVVDGVLSLIVSPKPVSKGKK